MYPLSLEAEKFSVEVIIFWATPHYILILCS